MKTVTLQVAKLDEVKRRVRDAFKGKKQGSRISFATPELLFRVLTTKRWELIRALTGAGAGHDSRGGASGRPRCEGRAR